MIIYKADYTRICHLCKVIKTTLEVDFQTTYKQIEITKKSKIDLEGNLEGDPRG
jgi:hypothetical protein